MAGEAAGRWGFRSATSLVSKDDAADVEDLFAARRRGDGRREAAGREAELTSPLSFVEASRLTERHTPSTSFCSSPPPANSARQERPHLDANVGHSPPGLLAAQQLQSPEGAALAANSMMESARRAAVEGSRRPVPADDRRLGTLERVRRVVGRLCDGAQRDRLRACLAGWTLLASRKASAGSSGSSTEELSRQLEAAKQANAEASRRWQLSEAKSRELTEQLSQQRKSSALLSDMAARRVSALEAELAKLKEAGTGAAIDPGGGLRGGAWAATGGRSRSSVGEPFQVRAVALLDRRDRSALLHDCFVRWHSSAAEGHAMQVRVMRERLERADAECCALRGQAQEAQARTEWAEAELLRRSGHEFARLRDLQSELAQLQAEALQGAAPGAASRSTSSGARVAAARAVANSFAGAMSRAWLKLCLAAWCAQASARSLSLALVAQCGAAEDAARCGRALAAWRLAVDRGRLLGAAYQLAEAASMRQATPLVRLALRRWHSVASEPADATVGNSLDACSPLSGQTFCSAVMWSPGEKSILADAACSTAAFAAALTGGAAGGSGLEEGGTGGAGGQRPASGKLAPWPSAAMPAPEEHERAPAEPVAATADGVDTCVNPGSAAAQRPWASWTSWGMSRKSSGGSRNFTSTAA